MPADFLIRPIEPRDDADIAAVIRQVMPEFGADGPGFAIHDAEVMAMSAAYARPRTAYFVVEMNGRAVGGGGMDRAGIPVAPHRPSADRPRRALRVKPRRSEGLSLGAPVPAFAASRSLSRTRAHLRWQWKCTT